MAVRRDLGAWEVCPACDGVGHTLHSCAPADYLRPGGLPRAPSGRRVSGQGDLFYEPKRRRTSPSGSLRSGVRVGDLTADQAQAIEDTLDEAGLA